jgi:hypothetical protein
MSSEQTCEVSEEWVVAAAPGLVVRSENGLVVQDLDGDGDEHTGWVLIYLHIDDLFRVTAGTWLETDDLIGHPSCVGGPASSVHLHIARRYNGEWILADGAIPFNMSGWEVHLDAESGKALLMKDGMIVTSSTGATRDTYIKRLKTDED